MIVRRSSLLPILFLGILSQAWAASPKLPLDLAPFHGKVVLVDFWASWCGPCAESIPWMAGMARDHGPQGLVVVAVNVDEDRQAAERFLAGKSLPFEMVFDPEGKIAEAFDLRVMPTSLLFDREGRPAGRHEGFHTAKTREYERDLVDLLEGRTQGSGNSGTAMSAAPASASSKGVRAWQRGLLAERAMQLDADVLDLEIDDHIYFSKEATSGGRSFGGGGCGCN